MSYGFKSIGDAGNVQIDQTYANLHYRASGSVMTTALTDGSGGLSGASYVDVAFTGCRHNLLAIRCALNATYFLLSKSGSTWTYRFIAAREGSSTSTVGTVIYYWRFDTAPLPSTETHGLRVWDASGNLNYDSGYKCLVLEDFKTGFNITTPDNGSLDWAYSSALSLAVIPGITGGNYLNVADPGGGAYSQLWYSHAIRSVNNYTFRFAALCTQLSNPPYWIQSYNSASDWLIIDVTGF